MRQFHFSYSLLPETTGTFHIGGSSLRWLEGFFTNLDVSNRATVPTPVNTTDAATKAYVDGLFNPVIGTIEEADGSPAITQATTLRFDQADGFVLTNPSSGVARLDLLAIPNSVLANSSVTVTAGTGMSGGGAVSLGGSVTLTLSTHDHQGTGAQGGTLDAAAIAAGTLAVARGGTNLGSGTSGGILGYTASGTLASSVALTANALVIGGGAGATPTPMTGTSGGVPYFNATTTVTSSGLLTANGVLYGGGAGAAPAATAQGGTNTVLVASAGAPSFSATPIINTSLQLGVVSTVTGALKLAHASSTNLTTLQAGNASAAVTYTLPTADGAASTFLQTNGSGTLAWATATSVSAATQAEMETATSTTVYASPGRVQYHPGVAKAWAHFDAGGAIAASYNVTSVTDSGTGNWTVNLTTGFSTASSYNVILGAMETDTALEHAYVADNGLGTTTIVVHCAIQDGTLTDPTGTVATGRIFISCYGDQ